MHSCRLSDLILFFLTTYFLYNTLAIHFCKENKTKYVINEFHSVLKETGRVRGLKKRAILVRGSGVHTC